jgi:hypothetical protein
MKKPIQELTAQEYLEEIRKVRSNPPEMTRDEFWNQYEEMQASREQNSPPGKPAPSGAGRRQMTAA